MALSPGVLVPVTALSSVVAWPNEVYDRYVRGCKPTPVPAMILGDLEHEARRILVEKLWQTYMTAKNPDDLRTSFDQICSSVEEATSTCERRYSVLFGNLQQSVGALSNRLRIEEDARMVAAENLLREGVSGVDLLRRVLPLKVETSLRSYELGLEGRVDAISELDGKPFPLEYKTGLIADPLRTKAHEIQVAAYCMLLEQDADTPCNYGEIYYTRYLARRPVVVTRSTRKAVLDLRDRFLKLCSENPREVSAAAEVSHA